MSSFHQTFGAIAILINGAAAVFGLTAWLRRRASRIFWAALRTGQALIMLQAVTGAALLLDGKKLPPLHLIYGLVPIAVAFVAEQLRFAATSTVLDQHDLEDADAVRQLPDSDQRALVVEIVRRETATMAASAAVVALLALRAQGWL